MASQHKLEKAKARRKDYEKKRNIRRNLPKSGRYRLSLTAGDGILPKSRKFTRPKKTTASVQ